MSKRFTTQIESTVPSGTAPLVIASPTLVENLNAQYLNGQLASFYATSSTPTLVGLVTISGNNNSLNLSGTPSSVARSTGLLQIGTLGFQDTGIMANFQHSVDSYAQVVLQNTSNGGTASTDVILNNNTGGASANYGDLGINSSTFAGGGVWDDPNGTYLYANGGTLTIGTQGTQSLKFATGNALRASIDSNGTFTIPTSASGTVNALTLSGTPSATNVNRGLLQVSQTVGYSDVNMIASFVGNINSYSQIVIQNLSAGTAASADVIVNNNSSTASSIYGDFGINSSAYTGTGPFNAANDVYLYSIGTEIVVGTRSAHSAIIATDEITRLTFSSGTAATATATFTAKINAPVSTNGRAGFNLGSSASGVAPTTPVDGDVWVESTGMYAQIGAATVGPFSAGGGSVSLSGNNSWTGTNSFSQPIISTFQNTAALGAIQVTSAQRTQTSARGQIHIGPDLPSADTTLGYVGVSSAATFFQNILQNTSTDVAASVDLVFYNNATSNGGNTLYFDLGMNSSNFAGGGPFDDPSGSYIYMDSASLSIGTTTSNTLRFATNTTTRMEISGAGAFTFAAGTTVSMPSLTVTSTATIPGYVGTNTTALDNILPFTRAGVYSTFVGGTKCRIPSNCTIVGISAMSANVSSAVTVQVNKNGVSIGTVSLGTGTNIISTETSLSNAVVAGDYLSIDVTAGGGTDLVVSIRYRPS